MKRRNFIWNLIAIGFSAILAFMFSCTNKKFEMTSVKHKVVSKEIIYNPASVPIWPHQLLEVVLENGDTIHYHYTTKITDSVEYIYAKEIK
jgi:hypothetical protein